VFARECLLGSETEEVIYVLPAVPSVELCLTAFEIGAFQGMCIYGDTGNLGDALCDTFALVVPSLSETAVSKGYWYDDIDIIEEMRYCELCCQCPAHIDAYLWSAVIFEVIDEVGDFRVAFIKEE
jgi:hypothetical protein